MDTDKLSKLKQLYDEATNCDKGIFSEQRTNILLKNGEHYKKRASEQFNNMRSRTKSTSSQKIRLVKNHIHKIVNIYENSILETNPSVTAMPYNDAELHDVKSAELNNAVLSWIKDTNSWEEMQEDFVNDFVVEGEMFAKVRFDYNKGKDVAIDELTGEVMKAGEFVIERIMPYDLRRDADSMTMRDARFLIETKLMNKSDFVDLAMGINPESVEAIKKFHNDTKMSVFDSSTGKYKETRGKVEVRIFYWRPSKLNPEGLYTVCTEKMVVGSVPLPLGIFPIICGGFDKLTNSPRSSSIIRVIKPFQIEYNRSNSKMAEHQITLGDDRVYIMNGSKLSGGKLRSGNREYHITGQAPIIQQGRSGAQYLDYAKDTKLDMYDAANIDYATLNKQPTGDSFQMLFAAMKDKKKFVKYVNKYGRFEVQIFKTALKMAKQYLSADNMISIAGKKEAINIEEFKTMEDNGFEFKVESSTGDIESKFGKVLSLTHVLQYAGSSLDPAQIGQVIKSLPYGNDARAFNTITVKSDNAENLLLSLDRGEYIPTLKHDDHEFMLQALYNRIKSSDFVTLPQEVQALYEQKIIEQEDALAMMNQQLQQSQMGAIPAGGFLTTVNASWFNESTNRVERIKVPAEAIKWLMEKLNAQGALASQVGQLPPQAVANIQGGAAPQEAQLPQANQGAIPQPAPQVQGV